MNISRIEDLPTVTFRMCLYASYAIPTKTSGAIRRAGLSLIKLNDHKHRVDYADSVLRA